MPFLCRNESIGIAASFFDICDEETQFHRSSNFVHFQTRTVSFRVRGINSARRTREGVRKLGFPAANADGR
jgi:hypothetical protein